MLFSFFLSFFHFCFGASHSNKPVEFPRCPIGEQVRGTKTPNLMLQCDSSPLSLSKLPSGLATERVAVCLGRWRRSNSPTSSPAASRHTSCADGWNRKCDTDCTCKCPPLRHPRQGCRVKGRGGGGGTSHVSTAE